MMRMFSRPAPIPAPITALIPAVLIGAMLAVAPLEARPSDPEAQLAKATAGRAAAAPVDCIFLRDISSSEIISRTAIVYRLNNGTVMVNRPASGANFLSRGDVLVTDTHSPQLCSIDIVHLLDSGSHMPSGSVGLGKFVPYPRPGRGR